jgi:signal transduction histidine kinase
LNNVFKHAEANEVTVSLRCQVARVELRVRDDGRGFDPASIPARHLGVGIMRERAETMGITLSIETAVGRGTEVVAVWAETGSESP